MTQPEFSADQNSILCGTDDLWRAAVAADRINNGYVKHHRYGSDIIANKTLVRTMLIDRAGWSYGDMQTAQQYHQYWRNQLLLLLDDTANGYDRAVAKISSQQFINKGDLLSVATIASAVTNTRERLHREKINQKKQQCDRSYIAAVGEKIKITAQVIDCRWVERVGAYLVEAVANARYLTQWWKDYPATPGASITVQAHVRSHSNDYYTKIPVTAINYTRY